MFLIKLFIYFLCCFHLSITGNETMEFCVVPFGQKRCKINVETDRMECNVDPLSIYRQLTCVAYQKRPLVLTLSNFAIFYPPYIDILFNLMKKNDMTYEFLDQVFVDFFLELDLHPFVYLIQPDNVEIRILFTYKTEKLNLTVNSPLNKSLTLGSLDHIGYLITLTMSSTTNKTMTRSMVKNDMLCYNFLFNSINNKTQIVEKYVTCPPNKCLRDENKTRSCIGSTPCYRTGFTSLSCRIDRLRSNDQFNTKTSFLYTDLIITTSDTHKHTLHKFSKDLLNSCITRRLVIIIIHGRLEVPSLNSTSFNCSYGLTVDVEFWHGNCSTFEILHSTDLERMYETNVITLGNFYTGRVDRLKIACAIQLSLPNTNGRFKLSISSWIMLSFIGIIILLICVIVLWYYQRPFRRYFIQIWRNLTVDKKMNTETKSTTISNVKGSSHSGLSITLNNMKGR